MRSYYWFLVLEAHNGTKTIQRALAEAEVMLVRAKSGGLA